MVWYDMVWRTAGIEALGIVGVLGYDYTGKEEQRYQNISLQSIKQASNVYKFKIFPQNHRR